ncbi:MAG: hypothetical protein ACLFQX_01325 [Candidatus Kapaibacterium sp.]
MQYAFAWTEGDGMSAIEKRMITTGHAEYARIAAERPDIYYVMKNYEELAGRGELGLYAPSKPPGTLLFYMLNARLAKCINGNDISGDELLVASRESASWLWPFICYIALIPLFLLAKDIFDQRTAIYACALYIVIPSINLITLHTDQTIYPLLFITSLWMAVKSAYQKNLLLAFIGGIIIYISVWFTFALMFIIPFVLAVVWISLHKKYHTQIVSYYLRIIMIGLAGFIIADVLFRYFLDYDIFERYRSAIQYHAQWRDWNADTLRTLYFGALGIVEYIVWIGIPISIIYVVGLKESLMNIYHKRTLSDLGILSTTLAIVIMIIALAGKSKGESARLWMFLIPYICMVVAVFIVRKFRSNSRMIITLIILLQFITVYLTKVNQDFY